MSNLPVTWQELAFVDAKLTEKWVDVIGVQARKVSLYLDCQPAYLSDLESFLDSEYAKSQKLVIFSPVDYLTDANFSQLVVFAKCDVDSKSEIHELVGFLVDIKEDEIVPGYNDFSVMESSRKGVQ